MMRARSRTVRGGIAGSESVVFLCIKYLVFCIYDL